jgi:hypothetical protein
MTWPPPPWRRTGPQRRLAPGYRVGLRVAPSWRAAPIGGKTGHAMPPSARSSFPCPSPQPVRRGIAPGIWPHGPRATPRFPRPRPRAAPRGRGRRSRPRRARSAVRRPRAPARPTSTREVRDHGAPAPDVTHATELELSAGGLFNSGNARSLAMTAGGRFRIRRKIHEFSAGLAGNYGRASCRNGRHHGLARHRQQRPGPPALRLLLPPADQRSSGWRPCASTPSSASSARVRVDPGLAFYILQQAKHRLWGEVGYDFQYDSRRVHDEKQDCESPAARHRGCFELRVPNVPQGMGARCRRPHASGPLAAPLRRLRQPALGRRHLHHRPRVHPAALAAEEQRRRPAQARRAGRRPHPLWVNWDAASPSQVMKALSFSTTFTLRYDNAPLPGIRRLDTITAVSLTYRFF